MTAFRTGTLLFTLAACALLVLTQNAAASANAPIQVKREPRKVHVSTPQMDLLFNLQTGRWEAEWKGRAALRPAIHGADCAVKLDNGTQVTASEYSGHTCLASDIAPIKDSLGSGTQIVIHHRMAGQPELRQIFRVYSNCSYFFVRLEAVSSHLLSTHDISPVVIDSAKTPGAAVDLGSGDKPRTLFVPYDNDSFIRYDSDYASSSFETTAVYDNASRHGFVIGSVTHDLWKTGITMGGTAPHRLTELRVFGGVTGKDTRDTQPHGSVIGTVVASPQVLVGYFPDWRDGMETYGRVNARLSPPIVWAGTVPIGWNSWAAYMTSVSSANYLAASDFLKATMQPLDSAAWTATYVNLDSFWDNFSVEKKIEDVRQIHARGQKAGIYWTPFVYWGSDLTQKVEGTGGRYTYGDAVLKDASGKPLPTLDGGLPMDPTHPATLERIDWECSQFVAWGFDFVKLDFLTHGSLEGIHFDPHITTGTAAYNAGMARVTADLSPSKIGRPFFISLSIAPLFPAGYGHSRRISCDTFGTIGNSEYMLNSLTYGWWQGGTIYAFNDGDHAVLYQAHGQPVTTPAEGRSRLNASVVAGSLILDSDDLLDPKARERVIPLLSNKEVMALAKEGKSFRPVEGDTGDQASDVFVRANHASGDFYVGVFNYSPSSPVTKHLDFSRLGLSPSAHYRVYDLWTRQISSAHGKLSVDLEAGSSTLLRLTHE
ncbi:MAG: alpha-galactosidase [Janthinobacterium lividum]